MNYFKKLILNIFCTILIVQSIFLLNEERIYIADLLLKINNYNIKLLNYLKNNDDNYQYYKDLYSIFLDRWKSITINNNRIIFNEINEEWASNLLNFLKNHKT